MNLKNKGFVKMQEGQLKHRGGVSLAVTLSADFVRSHGFNKDDPFTMYSDENDVLLIIRGKNAEEKLDSLLKRLEEKPECLTSKE